MLMGWATATRDASTWWEGIANRHVLQGLWDSCIGFLHPQQQSHANITQCVMFACDRPEDTPLQEEWGLVSSHKVAYV